MPTNLDRIHTMSATEFTKWRIENMSLCNICAYQNLQWCKRKDSYTCEKGIARWLNQPAEPVGNSDK